MGTVGVDREAIETLASGEPVVFDGVGSLRLVENSRRYSRTMKALRFSERDEPGALRRPSPFSHERWGFWGPYGLFRRVRLRPRNGVGPEREVIRFRASSYLRATLANEAPPPLGSERIRDALNQVTRIQRDPFSMIPKVPVHTSSTRFTERCRDWWGDPQGSPRRPPDGLPDTLARMLHEWEGCITGALEWLRVDELGKAAAYFGVPNHWPLCTASSDPRNDPEWRGELVQPNPWIVGVTGDEWTVSYIDEAEPSRVDEFIRAAVLVAIATADAASPIPDAAESVAFMEALVSMAPRAIGLAWMLPY